MSDRRVIAFASGTQRAVVLQRRDGRWQEELQLKHAQELGLELLHAIKDVEAQEERKARDRR